MGRLLILCQKEQSDMSCDELPDYQDSPKSVLKLLRALAEFDADKRQLKSETQRILFFSKAFVATSDALFEQPSQRQFSRPTCPWTH